MVQAILAKLNSSRKIELTPAIRAGFGKLSCGKIMWGGVAAGFVGVTDRDVADKVGLKYLPAIAELPLDLLVDGCIHVPQLVPLARFPAISRDVSMVVSDNVRFQQIESIVHDLKLVHLEALTHVTTYRGKPLDAGSKSVTINLSFRKADGTLTSDHVDQAIARVTQLAGEMLGATLRG